MSDFPCDCLFKKIYCPIPFVLCPFKELLEERSLEFFFFFGLNFLQILHLNVTCHHFLPLLCPYSQGGITQDRGDKVRKRKAPGVSWEKVSSFFGKEKYSGLKDLS